MFYKVKKHQVCDSIYWMNSYPSSTGTWGELWSSTGGANFRS